MTTEIKHLTVAGIKVEVVRKDIKNLHLGVYPPNGRVRVAAPLVVSDEAVRLAVIDKLAWIKRQRSNFEAQPRQSLREMVSGESHYFLGQRYRLKVVHQKSPTRIALRGKATMELHTPAANTSEQRERVLQAWYRAQLKALVPPLLDKWQRALGVEVTAWGVKKMKTKWGSCNPNAASIWVNLELAKKPVECLEYIIVHELMHMLERSHGSRFTSLLDQYLPNWQESRDKLNAMPLGHEQWVLSAAYGSSQWQTK